MNVFELARANITARDAAEHYGIKVKRNGMACCPFHPDKHPSMKIDQRFHCFGCQEDGDAVDLVAKLYGLGNYDAAVKLLGDFGIEYAKPKYEARSKDQKPRRKVSEKRQQELRIRKLEKQFEDWISHAKDVLLEYQQLLAIWKEQYKPAITDVQWHPLFEEALQMQAINEYHLDILFDGDNEEKLDFFEIIGKG